MYNWNDIIKHSHGNGCYQVAPTGAISSGVSPLYNFDFSSPVTQDLTLAGIESAVSGTAAAFYDCQEASGDMLDSVGSEDLTPTNSPLQNQGAYGIDDGSGIVARKAVEIVDSGMQFIADGADFMDVGTSECIAIVVVFRIPRVSLSNSATIIQKNSGGVGYQLRLLNTGGIRLNVDDGPNADNITVSASHADGAWHWACIKVDMANDLASLWTDLGQDSGSMATWGTLENAQALRFGNSSGSFVAQHQITMAACFRDAQCDDVTQANLNTWWTHGGDPTGLLTTATRVGSIGVPVASDKVCVYHGSAASVQLPIGYHSALPGSGFGLYVNDDDINLLSYSQDLTSWSDIGSPTTTALDGDGPNGTRSADAVTSNSTDEGKGLNAVTVAATEYTFSAWVELVSGNGAGQLELYDATGAVSLATQAFTATGTRTQVLLTATTNAGQISTDCRFTFDNSGAKIRVTDLQLNEGDGPTAHIGTNGASGTIARPSYISTDKLPTDAVRLEVNTVFPQLADGAARYFISNDNAAANYRLMYVNWNKHHVFQAGSYAPSYSTLALKNTYYEYVMRLDSDAGDMPEDGTYTGTAHVNGTVFTASTPYTTTWAPDANGDDLHLGVLSTNPRQNQMLQKVVIYAAPGEEPS